MGTWGAELFEDDTALDARDLFEDAVNAGVQPQVAVELVLRELEDPVADIDDGPIICLSLASLLLDHGVQSHAVIDQAREILEEGVGLDRWEEASTEDQAARRDVYHRLLSRLNGSGTADAFR